MLQTYRSFGCLVGEGGRRGKTTWCLWKRRKGEERRKTQRWRMHRECERFERCDKDDDV